MNARTLTVAAIAVLAVVAGFFAARHFARPALPDHVVVYYTRLDGETEEPWSVSVGAVHDLAGLARYAATQAVAGPAPEVSAIRFPAGTIVHDVVVHGGQADVDLGGALAQAHDDGSFGEAGEFKSLLWTLTALPSVTSVRVTLDGHSVASLPGGHVALDEPLTRSTF